MVNVRTALLLSSGFAALFANASAFAQEIAAEAAVTEASAAQDNENQIIVVTAQKREEKILDIPQSVTVVGGDTLERQNATTFEQYANLVPSLSLNETDPGQSRISLRGVNTGGIASTVAVYVDEIPFGSSSGLLNGGVLASDFDTFDVNRLEVLRGPQGTLYGASSLGGLIKFVTNEPKLGVFDARARAGVEFVDEGDVGYNFNAMFNAPLGDKAAFRASGFYRRNGGYIDAVPNQFPNSVFVDLGILDPLGTSKELNNFNDSDVWGGRGSVLFEPNDQLKIRLTAIAQKIETDGLSDVEVEPETYKPLHDDWTQTVIIPESTSVKYRIYNATIDYDLGFATLTSATAFARNKFKSRQDATLPFGMLFNALYGPYSFLLGIPPVTTSPIGVPIDAGFRLKKFTQEVRLASPSNETFEWLAGAYYTKEDGLVTNLIEAVDLNTGNAFTDPFLAQLFTAELGSKYKELAGFANATWHATDRFDITAGGRLSRNKQSAQQDVGGNFSALQFGCPTPDTGCSLPRAESDETVFTYSISPRFEINDQTAVYARVAKGYRPGGPNVIPLGAPEGFPPNYDADTLTSYELGLKADLDSHVSVDLAAFYNDWNDIQVIGVTPAGDDFNANGGTARSMGIEGTISARPVRGLNLSVNGAYIDAELTEDTPPITGGFDGDQLPWTPKFSFSVNADYDWALSSNIQAFVGGSLRYVGKQKGNINNGEFVGPGGDLNDPDNFVFTPQDKIPDYATLNLRAGAEFGHFSLEAFVRNVTNSHGVTSTTSFTNAELGGNAIPGDGILVGFTQPRTFGLTLTAGL
ncbi:TonB-dependent receptor [Sphingomonas sp. NSE70-1]|uniref:TonB-dependent receptor n=1 Tax=Sphingomonas caseinilyticus TaxID=2908205 RepID=A0ABT0RXQ8_9SPHN|nr:TonB-dependent receptor [Sphingomonas caseinilyticus]MCL6699689.1 TonB-dependent receptor [Sphingomonas caseinilyticus]